MLWRGRFVGALPGRGFLMKKSIVALVLLSACSKTPFERIQGMCERMSACFNGIEQTRCVEGAVRAYDNQTPSLKDLELQNVDEMANTATCDAAEKMFTNAVPGANIHCLRKDAHCAAPAYDGKKMLLDF